MATGEGLARARRLRRYLEDLWVDGGHGRRHGFVVGLAELSKVKRTTISSWFSETRPKEPQLASLAEIANALGVSRVEIVAAMDGVPLMTQEQAERIAAEELAKMVAAAQAEGLLPTPPRRPTVVPDGRTPRGSAR
jgi:transcriptional regulator with XRE-family HTH domain